VLSLLDSNPSKVTGEKSPTLLLNSKPPLDPQLEISSKLSKISTETSDSNTKSKPMISVSKKLNTTNGKLLSELELLKLKKTSLLPLTCSILFSTQEKLNSKKISLEMKN